MRRAKGHGWYTMGTRISSLRPISPIGEGNLECEKQEETQHQATHQLPFKGCISGPGDRANLQETT
jgi:hypothetical protein